MKIKNHNKKGNPDPNHSTRFSKENPRKNNTGKPKGAYNYSNIIRQIWDTPDASLKLGPNQAPRIRFCKAVIAVMKKAENESDVNAFKTLIERVEGMPKSDVTVTQRGRFEEFDGLSDDDILAKVKELD